MTEPVLKTRSCCWLPVPGVADPRGRINFLEVGKGLPFQPQRLFWLHHIAPGQWRGRHGHRESELVLVALHGAGSDPGDRLNALRRGRVFARLRGLQARSGGEVGMIPFLDMKAVYAELKPELDAAYTRVME